MTERVGNWMTTFTGRRVWPLDPRPEDFCIEDIAHHLAMICRWGGAARFHYSVAQHSFLVSKECDKSDALWGLFHDASEAFLGDVVSPIKKLDAMAPYRAAEAAMMAAICERFGLARQEPQSVKVADRVLLATEARDVAGGMATTWDLLPYPPKEYRIASMQPGDAEMFFLEQFKLLTVSA